MHLYNNQTLSEYRQKNFQCMETSLATIASGVAIAGTVASTGLAVYNATKKQGGASGSSGFPSYNGSGNVPNQQAFTAAQNAELALPFAQNQGSIFNTAAQQGLNFAQSGTAANVANQNAVTPGSSQQRVLANQELNSYISGQVPQDVQQNINRTVAQNLGGGFNLFSGGGQAPQNFARNIGQTSLGLSQYGLSAAPTWQQLANQMVVSPATGLAAGLQASNIADNRVLGAAQLGNQQVMGTSSAGLQNSENQYLSGVNSYQNNQLQQQNLANLGLSVAGAGTNIANSQTMANYYNGLPSVNSSFNGGPQPNSNGFYPTASAATIAATGDNGQVGQIGQYNGQYYIK